MKTVFEATPLGFKENPKVKDSNYVGTMSEALTPRW